MQRTHYHYDPQKLLKSSANSTLNSDAPISPRTFVVCDAAFQTLKIPQAYRTLFTQFPVQWVTAGENCKTIDQAQKLWSWLEASGADRSDRIIAIGGGTVLDLAAFVASTFKRGICFSLIPTTLLGLVDASIGGKNGVNFNGIKNTIGTFAEPDNIYLDIEWLKTLPDSELLNGWMELCKHALIRDKILWKTLEQFGPSDPVINWKQLVFEGSSIKRDIIAHDFYEHGERKQLNFGHTVAHALEGIAAASAFKLDHGFAVGVGMVAALRWSELHAQEANEKEAMVDAIVSLRGWLEMPENITVWKWCTEKPAEALWPFMLKDKKNSGGVVRDIQLTKIGDAKWDCPLLKDDFANAWASAF